MKFNHQRAGDALYTFIAGCLLVALVLGLRLAWKAEPLLGAYFTSLIAVPIVAGLWPTKEKK